MAVTLSHVDAKLQRFLLWRHTLARFAFGQPVGFYHSSDGKIHPIMGGQASPADGQWARENQDTTQGHQFPTNLSQLEDHGVLGGSTGPHLMVDPQTGQKYVMKKGNSPDHVESEMVADQAYHALGANTAPFQRYVDENGAPTKLAKFIPGQTLADIEKNGSPELKAAAHAVLAPHLAKHALLANWDAHGLEGDNVIFSHENDQPYFIDNGGSLEYRAQGAPKGNAFSDKAGELKTLRDPDKNPLSARIYNGLDNQDVRGQVTDLKGKIGNLASVLPQHLKTKIAVRMHNMDMNTSSTSGMGGLTS